MKMCFCRGDQRPFRQQLTDVMDSATPLIGLSPSPRTLGSICPVANTVKRKLLFRKKKKTENTSTKAFDKKKIKGSFQ